MTSKILLRKRTAVNYKLDGTISRKVSKPNSSDSVKKANDLLSPNQRDKVVTQDGRTFYPCQYCSRAFVDKARRSIHLNSCSAKAYILSVGGENALSSSNLSEGKTNQTQQSEGETATENETTSTASSTHNTGKQNSKSIEIPHVSKQSHKTNNNNNIKSKLNNANGNVNSKGDLISTTIERVVSKGDLISATIESVISKGDSISDTIDSVIAESNLMHESTNPLKLPPKMLESPNKMDTSTKGNIKEVFSTNSPSPKNLKQQKLKTVTKQTVIRNPINNLESVVFEKLLLMDPTLEGISIKPKLVNANVESNLCAPIKPNLHAKLFKQVKTKCLPNKGNNINKKNKSEGIKKPRVNKKIKENLLKLGANNEVLNQSQKLPLTQSNTCGTVTKVANTNKSGKMPQAKSTMNKLKQSIDITNLERVLSESYKEFTNGIDIKQKGLKKKNSNTVKNKNSNGIIKWDHLKTLKKSTNKAKENCVSENYIIPAETVSDNVASPGENIDSDKLDEEIGNNIDSAPDVLPTILNPSTEPLHLVNGETPTVPNHNNKKVSRTKQKLVVRKIVKQKKPATKTQKKAAKVKMQQGSPLKIVIKNASPSSQNSEVITPLDTKINKKDTKKTKGKKMITLKKHLFKNDEPLIADKDVTSLPETLKITKTSKPRNHRLKKVATSNLLERSIPDTKVNNVDEKAVSVPKERPQNISEQDANIFQNMNQINKDILSDISKIRDQIQVSLQSQKQDKPKEANVLKAKARKNLKSDQHVDTRSIETQAKQGSSDIHLKATKKVEGKQNASNIIRKVKVPKSKTKNTEIMKKQGPKNKTDMAQNISLKVVKKGRKVQNKKSSKKISNQDDVLLQNNIQLQNKDSVTSESKDSTSIPKQSGLKLSLNNMAVNIDLQNHNDGRLQSQNHITSKSNDSVRLQNQGASNARLKNGGDLKLQMKTVYGGIVRSKQRNERIINNNLEILDPKTSSIFMDNEDNISSLSDYDNENASTINVSAKTTKTVKLYDTNQNNGDRKALPVAATQTDGAPTTSGVPVAYQRPMVSTPKVLKDAAVQTVPVNDTVSHETEEQVQENEPTEGRFNEELNEEIESMLVDDDLLPNQNQPVSSPKQVECKYCKITVASELDLLRHKREAHRYPKVLVSKKNLEKYYDMKDRSHCPICKKPMAAKHQFRSYFIKHLQTHSDETKFSCPKCFKKFKRQDHMKAHEKRHF